MNKKWEPEFDGWSEDRVSLSSCELSTHSSSRNEYGVIMQVREGGEPNVKDAAIFWIDPMHIYFRYSWGQWYKVSNDDPDNCASICKRNTATLLLCTTTSVKHHAVRVYHVDKLPEELFGRQEDEDATKKNDTQSEFELEVPPPPVISFDDDGAPDATLLKPMEPFASDADEEKEIEKQVDEFVTHTMPVYDEIQAAIDAEIDKHGGCIYSRYRSGNNRLYSYDFAQIGKRFYIIVYADLAGEWLADEEAFLEERPLWFSESKHMVSPVYQAMRSQAYFMQELPHIKIESMVILSNRCVVINDEDMRECWNDKCGTAVVHSQKIDETTLQTLREYLAFQHDDDVEVPKLDVAEIAAMSSRFAANQENLINKD